MHWPAAMPPRAALFAILISFCPNPTESVPLQKDFSKIGNGAIRNASEIVNVRSALECAFLCAMKKVCKAFSVKNKSNSSAETTCRLSMGNFAWDSSTEETLYHLSIDKTSSYTFMKDGKYYVRYPDMAVYSDNIKRCDNEGATVAPCYRNEDKQILMSMMPPFSQYVCGALLTSNFSEGRWVTIDGDVFNHNNKDSDPLQVWGASNPNNEGVLIIANSLGTHMEYDDNPFDRKDWPVPHICRKTFGYEKSPINGKYYALHHEPVTGYDDAQRICQSEGGNLANILTAPNFAAVEGYLVQVTLSHTRMMVGGTDRSVEGTWVMPDGSTPDAADQLWNRPAEPNGENQENCIYFDYVGFGKGLGDFSCNEPFRAGDKFLCEIIL